VLQVGLDRVQGHEEPRRDVLVGEAGGGQSPLGLALLEG
jgi:hypothetical protein